MAASSPVAAFFDVDRTLVGPRSMERVFVAHLLREGFLSPGDLARYLGACLGGVRDGASGLRQAKTNKRHLRHKDPRELARLAGVCFRREIVPLISPAGRRVLEEHRRQGRLVVLITGTLQPLAALLAEELGADLALAAGLAEEHGRLSGDLSTPRPYGLEKVRLARAVAASHGLDLAGSYAYGDHHSDRHLLASVGHPYAVNPHPLLRREARRRGWPILQF